MGIVFGKHLPPVLLLLIVFSPLLAPDNTTGELLFGLVIVAIIGKWAWDTRHMGSNWKGTLWFPIGCIILGLIINFPIILMIIIPILIILFFFGTNTVPSEFEISWNQFWDSMTEEEADLLWQEATRSVKYTEPIQEDEDNG